MLLSCRGMAILSQGFIHGLAGKTAQPFRDHPVEAELAGLLPQRALLSSSFTPLGWCFPANVSNPLGRIVQLPGVLNSKWVYVLRHRFLWGIWPPSSQTCVFFQILFNNGRKRGSTKMERNCCNRKAWTRIFPPAFPNTVLKSLLRGQHGSLASFIAHVGTISQFNPLGNAQIFLCWRKVTQNSV